MKATISKEPELVNVYYPSRLGTVRLAKRQVPEFVGHKMAQTRRGVVVASDGTVTDYDVGGQHDFEVRK